MNISIKNEPVLHQSLNIKKYVWILGAIWSCIVFGFLSWIVFQNRNATQQTAILEARANFNKDQAFRLWATSHGGVYVPVDAQTPPNPYLMHIQERDLETPSGKKLTLMNPAYVVRQMNEEFNALYGITGHITSLNPLRPENAPDEWEEAALREFEKGETERLEFTVEFGKPYLRLMQPMVTQDGCLKCHAHQGYKVGDIRGGVGIKLPMISLIAYEKQRNRVSFVVLGILWLLGILGLAFGGNSIYQRYNERNKAMEDLQLAQEETLKSNQEMAILQAQLLQSQKLESVGRLAGGVAHDFNNMLSVILGHTEMALEQTPSTQPVFEDLQQVHYAATRSAKLTQQLLAFARKQVIAPKVLELDKCVEDMLTLLHRMIGENIQVIWTPSKKGGFIRMDPTQLDQILTNLCINARDAIGKEGTITIETDLRTIDEESCLNFLECVPGDYVMLTVSDTGCGMDLETVSKVFEPFYTTKEFGAGSGLGLAMVYGIVKQNNGFIHIESTKDQGTSFQIFIPKYTSSSISSAKKDTEPATGGHETILLVEDEASTLEMTRRMLVRLGYNVMAAPTPSECLRVVDTYQGQIDLILTDVIMPEMNGLDLSVKIKDRFPNMKVLFMSGYTADILATQGVSEERIQFMEKPFTISMLSSKVRQTLDTNQPTRQ